MSVVTEVIVFALMLSMVGCITGWDGGPTIEGSGTSASEKREVPAFTRVRLDGAADVKITVGQAQSVTVNADDNIVPIIVTEVRGGDTLVITSRQSYTARARVRVDITVESLEAVTILGSGNVEASGVKSPHFAATVNGSGDVTLQGDGNTIECAIAGSGNIDAMRFAAVRGTARVTGSGNVDLNASDSVDAQITGSGDVRYRGGAKEVKQTISGSGAVKPM